MLKIVAERREEKVWGERDEYICVSKNRENQVAEDFTREA